MPNPRRAHRLAALPLAAGVTVMALVAAALTAPALATTGEVQTKAAQAGTTSKRTAGQDSYWSRARSAKHALARAKKALSPSTPANERPDATLVLAELFLLKDALSPAEQAEAKRLTARPRKPATVGNEHFAIHYDPAELNPTHGYTIEQALATLQFVSDSYANAGYRRPKGDGNRGGDSRIDIYLDTLEPGLYGYCTTDQQKLRAPGRFDVWAYCVLDNDYLGPAFSRNTPLQNLQVTAAHEYYHAIQFAYDVAEDNWLKEATAVAMEDELYPTVDDSLQYLANSPITRPRKPIDRFGNGFHYGVWNFFRYLTERYPARTGGLPDLLLKIWKYADSAKGPRKDRYSTQAINKALRKVGRSSLAAEFTSYSAATAFPQQTFAEGALYPTKRMAGSAVLGKGGKKRFKAKLNHLTSATFQLQPDGSATKLKVQLRMAAKKTSPRAIAVIQHIDGSLTFEAIKVNRRGKGKTKLPFDASVAQVQITVVNASTRYRSCFRDQTPFSCSGIPMDDRKRAVISVKAR